jgi:rubrerythrin
MTDESHDNQDESQDNQGVAVPLNWDCTNCDYRVEGELPEKCPDCGSDREEFVTPDATPVSTLTFTVSPRTRSSP